MPSSSVSPSSFFFDPTAHFFDPTSSIVCDPTDDINGDDEWKAGAKDRATCTTVQHFSQASLWAHRQRRATDSACDCKTCNHNSVCLSNDACSSHPLCVDLHVHRVRKWSKVGSFCHNNSPHTQPDGAPHDWRLVKRYNVVLLGRNVRYWPRAWDASALGEAAARLANVVKLLHRYFAVAVQVKPFEKSGAKHVEQGAGRQEKHTDGSARSFVLDLGQQKVGDSAQDCHHEALLLHLRQPAVLREHKLLHALIHYEKVVARKVSLINLG